MLHDCHQVVVPFSMIMANCPRLTIVSPWHRFLLTVLVKSWTPEKISGMFIVLRPIRCEMKQQKITDKPQQGSVTTWCETTSCPFLLREIFNFPFVSLHQTPLVTGFRLFRNQTTKLTLKWVQIVKIYNGTGSRRSSATKIYGSKTTNHSQLAWPFELLNCTWNKHRGTLLVIGSFFLFLRGLSDALSSCVWSTDPVSLIEHRFSVKCQSYLFYQSRNWERKISVSENGKTED